MKLEGEGLRLSSPIIPHRLTLPEDEEEMDAAAVGMTECVVVAGVDKCSGRTEAALLQILLLRVVKSSCGSLFGKKDGTGHVEEDD